MLSKIQRSQAFKEITSLLELPLGTKAVENLNKAYSISSLLGEEDELRALEKDVSDLVSVHVPEIPVFKYPNQENSTGDLFLGFAASSRPYPFGLSLNELNQHLLVVGRSGVGKTSLNYLIAIQLHHLRVPFWIFDFKKDYRHLVKFFGRDVLVIKAENFRFNPLKPPPGVSVKRWISTFVDVFSHSSGVMYASKSYLMHNLSQTFDFYGEGKYPSVYELMEMLNLQYTSLMSKEARYNEVCRNRTESLIDSIGDILDCSEGFPLEDLIGKNVVWEFDSLGEDFKSFLTEIILAWVFTYRMSVGYRRKLCHITICDEGKLIFSRHKEYSSELGIPIIDTLTSQMREFGEGLIVSDQEPGKLTESIKANSFTKICFNLGSGKDIQDMSRCMGLNKDQEKTCYNLQTGQAIIKLSDRHTSAFPIVVPYVQVQKDVTDRQIDYLMKPILANMKVVPRVRTREFDEHVIELTLKRKVRGKTTERVRDWRTEEKEKKEAEKEIKVSEEKKSFILHVNENPFIAMSERYKKLNLTTRRGDEIKKDLIADGFFREVEINLGKVGGRKKLLEMTDKAKEYLENEKIQVKERGKRGIEHRFWQEKIKEFYEAKGCKVVLEHPLEGGFVDLVVDGKTAVEIGLSSRYELENMVKCIKAGFEKIISVCRDREIQSKVEEEVKKYFEGKIPKEIEFRLVFDYIA